MHLATSGQVHFMGAISFMYTESVISTLRRKET